jgi:hypothetical protein
MLEGMKLKRFAAALLVAFTCAAETNPPEPKSKETSKPTVIVVAPVVRYRYSGYSLLGNLIGVGIRTGIEAWREKKQNERMANEATYEPAPYVRQYYDAPSLTEMIIESNPPGANIAINAVAVGVTPQTRLEKPGRIYLLIRADGYDDFIHEFTAGGAPVHVIAELKHQPNHAESNVIVIK